MLIQRQGDARPYRRARTWLVATSILASGLAVPAVAQTIDPPPYANGDSNGVDMVTGKFNFSMTEGSIGTGENEIVLERILLEGARWTDNWSGKLRREINGGTTAAMLEFGAISDAFILSGSSAIPTKGDGSSLTIGGNDTYTFTSRNGTIFVFETKDDDAPIYTADCAPGGNSQRLCGVPVSITKPNGAQFALEWQVHRECNFDENGDCASERAFVRLTAIASKSGNRVEFQYDDEAEGGSFAWYQRLSARFIGVGDGCDTDCRAVTYTRSSAGGSSILTVSDPLSNQWQFTTSGTSLGIRRPGSNSDDIAVTLATDRIVTAVTRDGVTKGYARSVAGSTATTTITDALSHATVVEADLTRGRITSVKNPLNQTTSYQFDTNGRLTRTTLPEGNYVENAYDARGNVTQVTRVDKGGSGPNDIITSASYSSTCANVKVCNQPNSTTDARGKVTDYTYDTAHGGTLTVTRPAAASGGTRPQTRYSYSTVAGISLLTGASACRTSATCDGTADETKSIAVYDTQHRLTSMTAAAGDGSLSATTTYDYDLVGNVATVDGPLAGTADTTTYRHDASRRVTGVISADPDGSGSLKRRAQKITYDGVGRVTQQERGTVTATDDTAWSAFATAEKVTTTWTSGRKTKDVLSSGSTDFAVTHYGYDNRGSLVCIAQRMDPAQWAGQSDSCTPQTTGPNGPDRVEQRGIDALGRAIEYHHAFGTAAASHDYVSFTANGQIETATDGKGNKTTYEYDGHDRLKKTRYPSTSSTGTSSTTDYEELAYDAGSNVTSARLRDGQAIGFSYDDLSRLTIKDLPGNNPDTSYSYDLTGRMTGATDTGGQTLSFGYDALGRNVSAGANLGTLAYQYDLAGRRTRITHPDSFYAQYDYLVTGEVSAIRENGATSGAGVLATFAYDDLGRRTGLMRGNGTSTSYAYDPVSRLTSLGHDIGGTTHDVSFAFTYNPASGVASRTRDNDTYAFGGFANVNRADTLNGLNQVMATGGTSLTHDARGNITEVGSAGYSYDIENRMSAGGLFSAIKYDPLGRLRQVIYGIPRSFMWDGSDLALEYNENDLIQRRYIHGPGIDEPLVWYGGSGTNEKRWFHADERKSIIATSNSTGTSLGVSRYDEYGVPASGNGGRFGYTGQIWMPEMGLYYYKARFYNPALGRFMQTDPIGYGDGANLYGYVGADPINKIDPRGTTQICWGGPDGSPGQWINGEIVTVITRRECADFNEGGYTSPGDGAGAPGRQVIVKLPTDAEIVAREEKFCQSNPLIQEALKNKNVQDSIKQSIRDASSTKKEHGFIYGRQIGGSKGVTDISSGAGTIMDVPSHFSALLDGIWYREIMFHVHPSPAPAGISYGSGSDFETAQSGILVVAITEDGKMYCAGPRG